MIKVIIYSTPSCSYCRMAKDFFEENKVEYEDFDVSTDMEKQKEMIEKSGQMGVPVIVINGELVVGFDQEKIKQLLGL